MRIAQVIVVASLCAGALRAQDSKTLVHELDVAVARRDSARRELDDYRRQHPPKAFTDTFAMRGTAIQVVATNDAAPAARAAAQRTATELSGRLGNAVRLIGPMRFYVRVDSTSRGKAFRAGVLMRGKDETFSRDAMDINALSSAFTMLAQNGLIDQIDAKYRLKIGGALPMDTVGDGEWASMRVSMATSYSPVAARCLTEDVQACRLVLGLDSTIDQTATLFDAPGRRAYVAQIYYTESAPRITQQDCLHGNDAACTALMRREHHDLVIGGRAHATLASEAYRIGGSDALTRLLSAHGSEVQIVEAMSRAPIDTVVATWARKLRTRGAVSTSFSATIAGVAIGWLIVFVLLAMRSSRWR